MVNYTRKGRRHAWCGRKHGWYGSRHAYCLLAALLPGLYACGSGEAANPIRDALAAEASAPALDTPVVLRFPANPGPGVRLYKFPALIEVEWRFDTPTIAASHVVGFTSTEQQIYVQKDSSELLALDLQSGRDYTVDSVVAAAVIGPTGTPHLVDLDGSLATVVDRHTRRWDSIVLEQPKRIWGTTGGSLLALIETEAGRRLELFTDTGRIATIELPTGLLAVTRWGDLVAVAADSGLIIQRTNHNRSDGVKFLPLASEVTAMVFSAAGHYLFIATAKHELLVVNRFQSTNPEKYPLAHRVEAMRTGPLGQFLLLRPEGRDSLWIAEEAELANVVSVAGSWQDDLPAIASDGTVLVRQGDDVVAIDPETGARRGRIENSARDRWLAIAWDPRRPTLQLAEEAATDDQQETTGEEDQTKFYVQLSSTSNLTWAQARRDELLQAQLRALVLYPTEYYDIYRVVLGPYGTREEADHIGRRLGQPYFLLPMRDPTATNQ